MASLLTDFFTLSTYVDVNSKEHEGTFSVHAPHYSPDRLRYATLIRIERAMYAHIYKIKNIEKIKKHQKTCFLRKNKKHKKRFFHL